MFFQLLVSVSAFGIIAQIGLSKVIFSFLLNRIWLQQTFLYLATVWDNNEVN